MRGFAYILPKGILTLKMMTNKIRTHWSRGSLELLLRIPSGSRARLSSPHAVREGLAAFVMPEVEEVRERIDMRGRDVRIGGEIRRGVEVHRRVAPLFPAERVIVIERIDARRRHVRIGREVSAHVEQRVRVAALVPADGLEVRERIDVRGRDVGVVLQIVDVVEAVGGDQLARRRERQASLAGADLQEVQQRIDLAAATSA